MTEAATLAHDAALAEESLSSALEELATGA
jgi:hypothetical protein